MKRKLFTGLAIGFLVFGMVWSSGAATIVPHINVPTQLGGITEVEFVDGSFWDATFYNQWSRSGNQDVYTYDFAQNASSALYAVFTEFPFYDANPHMTWGIDNTGIGNLITPISYSTGSYGGHTMLGYAFVNKGSNGGYDTTALISGAFQDQDDTHSYVQWTASATDNSGSDPVPEPATMLLFGLGLLGLAGVSRKKA